MIVLPNGLPSWSPLFLSEGAFNIYQGLEEKIRSDYGKLKGALQQAFFINAGVAYERFQVWHPLSDWKVNVYLADLTRLCRIIHPVISDLLLKYAFAAGISPCVIDRIRTSDHLSHMSLACTVEAARIFCYSYPLQAVVDHVMQKMKLSYEPSLTQRAQAVMINDEWVAALIRSGCSRSIISVEILAGWRCN